MKLRQFIVFLLLTLLCSCSSGGDSSKKETLQEKSAKVGHNAAAQIQATLDKAEVARKIQEDHMSTIEKAVQENQ